MRYLLDTNAITALANYNKATWTNLNQLSRDDELYTCFIVVGEWKYGLCNTSKRQRVEIESSSKPIFDSFKGIWNSTYKVSLQYGVYQAHLRSIGQMIPSNDIWIAATATMNNATVVTADSHFSRLHDLKVVTWI